MDLLFIIWNFYLLYGPSIYIWTLYRCSIYYMELLFIIGPSIYYIEVLFIMSPFIINAQHFRPPTYYFTFLLFITQWHFDPNGGPYLCSMYIVYELLNNLC